MVAEGDYKRVLKLVASWPAEDRIALARELLSVRTPVAPDAAARQPSFELAYGMFRVPGKPAPTDDEVRRMIDEHRTQKYGQ
jgi:hypothetical protein